MYLVGVALICVGNLAFYWRPVLSLEDLSSLIGSSGSSGDTEVSILIMILGSELSRMSQVSSDTGSCNAVELDMTPASALVQGSPPYHLQVKRKIFCYHQQNISLSSSLEETD